MGHTDISEEKIVKTENAISFLLQVLYRNTFDMAKLWGQFFHHDKLTFLFFSRQSDDKIIQGIYDD